MTVDEMESTVAEFYQRVTDEVPLVDLALDTDLRDIFDASKRRKTASERSEFLHAHRKSVVDKVAYWTGAQRPLIKRLIEVIEKRIGELGSVCRSATGIRTFDPDHRVRDCISHELHGAGKVCASMICRASILHVKDDYEEL